MRRGSHQGLHDGPPARLCPTPQAALQGTRCPAEQGAWGRGKIAHNSGAGAGCGTCEAQHTRQLRRRRQLQGTRGAHRHIGTHAHLQAKVPMPDNMDRYSLLPSTRAMPMSQILAVPCRLSRMLAAGKDKEERLQPGRGFRKSADMKPLGHRQPPLNGCGAQGRRGGEACSGSAACMCERWGATRGSLPKHPREQPPAAQLHYAQLHADRALMSTEGGRSQPQAQRRCRPKPRPSAAAGSAPGPAPQQAQPASPLLRSRCTMRRWCR